MKEDVFFKTTRVPDELMPEKIMAQFFKAAVYETVGFGKTHWVNTE